MMPVSLLISTAFDKIPQVPLLLGAEVSPALVVVADQFPACLSPVPLRLQDISAAGEGRSRLA